MDEPRIEVNGPDPRNVFLTHLRDWLIARGDPRWKASADGGSITDLANAAADFCKWMAEQTEPGNISEGTERVAKLRKKA